MSENLLALLEAAEDSFEAPMESEVPSATAPVIPENAILVDGYWLDEESGEIYGLEQPKPEFTICDDVSLGWFLGKLIDAEAAIAAIDGDADVIRANAVLANADAMRRKAESRQNWLLARFQDEAAAYAKSKLKGKSRTHETVLGKISFTAVPEKLSVADEGMAIRWAKYYAPEAIRIEEKFLISQVPKEVKEFITDRDLGFKTEPATERVKIKTGVGK